jgi:hypothetical protein
MTPAKNSPNLFALVVGFWRLLCRLWRPACCLWQAGRRFHEWLLPGLFLASPFSIYLISLLIVGAAPALLGGPLPPVLAGLVGHWWTRLWCAEILAGSCLYLAGALRGRIRYQIGGLKVVGWASLAYSIALLTAWARGPFGALGYVLGLGVAAFAQAAYLRRLARAVQRHALLREELRQEEESR